MNSTIMMTSPLSDTELTSNLNDDTINEKNEMQNHGLLRTSSSDMTSSTRSSNSRIHFDLSKNDIHFVTRLQDMSNEEMENTWYDRYEQSMIKSRIRIFTKMMKSGVPENDNLTYRGLECRSRDGTQLRINRRREANQVLYDVQIDARSKGMENDLERLARAVRCCTFEAQREAVDVARQDALNAQKCFDKEDHPIFDKCDGKLDDDHTASTSQESFTSRLDDSSSMDFDLVVVEKQQQQDNTTVDVKDMSNPLMKRISSCRRLKLLWKKGKNINKKSLRTKKSS